MGHTVIILSQEYIVRPYRKFVSKHCFNSWLYKSSVRRPDCKTSGFLSIVILQKCDFHHNYAELQAVNTIHRTDMDLVHSSVSEDLAVFMQTEKHSTAGHEVQPWSGNKTNTQKSWWPSQITMAASSLSLFPFATDSLVFGVLVCVSLLHQFNPGFHILLDPSLLLVS